MEFSSDNVSNANNSKSSTTDENQANHRPVTEVLPHLNNDIQQRINNIVAADSVRESGGSSRLSIVLEMPPNDSNKETSEVGPILNSAEMSEAKGSEFKKSHKEPKKEWKKTPDVVTFRTHLTSLAHVSVVLFVYTVLKLAFSGDFVFFTWHPILMSIGWMLLMTEGLYSINKYNTYWRFKTKGGLRVKIHVIILSTGYILAVIGFLIAYINKDNKGKPHFATWHALFGLIALVSTCPPIINGFLLWYKKELANYIPNPKLVKFVHVTSGTLAFSFGTMSLILSVYTNWYGKKSNHSTYLYYFGLATVVYPLFWAIYGPSVKLAIVIKDYFSEDKED